jgi:hypothetical protein
MQEKKEGKRRYVSLLIGKKEKDSDPEAATLRYVVIVSI